jgi:epoxyqueuosine reductase
MGRQERSMEVKELKGIFQQISPYKVRILKTDDILKWQDKNSDNENISLLDFSEIKDFDGVVIAGFEYNPKEPVLPDGCMAVSPYYYFSNRYYMKLKKELMPYENGGEIRILRDTSLKILANISGLGYYGKNSLIHNDEFGTSMFLYGLAINIGEDDFKWNDINNKFTDCGNCRRCVDACPTGALDENGIFNREKCVRNYMLEGIEVPEEMKKHMGKRLLGCNICREACPKNNRLSLTEEMPDYDREIFLVRNYLDNRDKGLKRFINPLSQWIGKNYARTRRVLYQCQIIDENCRDKE